jgi:hypothetical protein
MNGGVSSVGCRVSGEENACVGGTAENSPAFKRWDGHGKTSSPEGTTDPPPLHFGRPLGTCSALHPIPALKRWAFVRCPFGKETRNRNVPTGMPALPA